MTDYFTIQLPADEIRGISSIGLAHLGDGVYELMVRERLVCQANRPVNELHKQAVAMVRAEAQAAAMDAILPRLTEEEAAVFRRGRNANVHSIPAHASRAQYQQATALEALLGWLHLSGRHDRVEQLFAVMMEGE